MADQALITVILGVQNQTFLRQLKLVHHEHDDDADQQRNEGGIKGDPQALSDAGHAGRYPGFCRDKSLAPTTASTRIRTSDRRVAFEDQCLGRVESALQEDSGDFIVRRRDGLYAYHLAVVVDDAMQGITEVVRGSDLLDLTACQIFVQQCLGFPAPAYLHHPVATTGGEKLSKQTGATAIDNGRPVDNLIAVLRFLGQSPPPGLEQETLAAVHQWALSHWDATRIPRTRAIEL